MTIKRILISVLIDIFGDFINLIFINVIVDNKDNK